MTDILATNPLTISAAESPRYPFLNSCSNRTQLIPNSRVSFSPKPFKTSCNNNRGVSLALSSRSNEGPSRGHGFYDELEFQDVKEKTLGLERNPVVGEDSPTETGSLSFDGVEGGGDHDKGEDDLVRVQGDGDGDVLKKEDDQGENENFGGKLRVRRGKQVVRRSNLLAKQVISIRSALSLGFVSQLWVDTTSWMVLFVEVRPNLLSGDSEKFLLEDISQVGDVVLVQDESVIDNEFKMIGLETLVGYKVVTPSRRNIGKVRGYTFSINSGAVEELELDSFGLSIIPSSLVSTYSLLVEDVLEVVSDAIVVHEAAALRIQRLSKGFLGNQNVRISVDDDEDYDSEQSETYGHISKRRRSFGRKKTQRDWDDEDNWELPMDYL